MKVALPFLVFLVLSCSQDVKFKTFTIQRGDIVETVSLKPFSSFEGCRLSVASSLDLDEVLFRYKPYHLDTGDINRDGRTDILLGLIKPTRFDPEIKKRLFILQIDSGKIRPLWLGSKVCQRLLEFKTFHTGKEVQVMTIEESRDEDYLIGNYRWDEFGLVLVGYTFRDNSKRNIYEKFYAE